MFMMSAINPQANDGEDLFIATQGPKRNTVVDFWNMILEQKVDTVVCLTNVVEGGQVSVNQALKRGR